MKPDTRVWLLCESVGRPANTIKMNDTVRECIKTIAQWLMGVYMGQRIRIILARTEAELETKSKSSAPADIMSDLESLLGGTPEEEELSPAQRISRDSGGDE